MKSIPKILIAAFLVVMLFGMVGYKIYEGKSMKKLEQLYNQATLKELTLTEEVGKQSIKGIPVIEKLGSEDVVSTDDRIKIIDNVVTIANVLLYMEENYLKELEQNQKQFEEKKQKGWIYIGSAGKSYRAIVDAQLAFYNSEITRARNDITGNGFILIAYMGVLKDRLLFDSAELKAKNKKGEYDYNKLFGSISFLSKYTEGNFKYDNEEKIKEMNPYAYEILAKTRDFFKINYLISKDLYKGEKESAAYKSSGLNIASAELNLDMDRLSSEGDDLGINNMKDTIEVTLKKIKLIKEFKKTGVSYPFIGKIDQWEEDLDLCNLYFMKTDLYNDITKKYPESPNFNDFIKELSMISPKTTDIDNDFPTDHAKFTQDEKNIEFVCMTNNPEQSFTFVITKETKN